MSYPTDQLERGRELLATVVQRGSRTFAELAGGPDWSRFLPQGPELLAIETARILAARGQEITPEAIESELRQSGATAGAATAREATQLALEAFGGTVEPGRACRIVYELSDLAATHRNAQKRSLGVEDIFAPLPPVNWMCQALDMAPGAPTLLAGYGFSGKTIFAQDLALAVATDGLAWGAFRVRTGRALHLDYEQGAYLTRSRYQRLARARGVLPAEGRLQVHVLPDWYVDGDAGRRLEDLASGVDLVVVDSFRAACPSTDENSSEARTPLDRLGRISEASGATFVVIHHARKPQKDSQGGSRMSVRGSGALYDACSSVLVFSGEKGEPVTVSHEKARISGRTAEDFRLWIEDVDVDGAPPGLRVTRIDAKPPRPSARFEELKGRVLALVRAEGRLNGGANRVCAMFGGHLDGAPGVRRGDVTAAVAALLQEGLLRNAGSPSRPVLVPAEPTPAEVAP